MSDRTRDAVVLALGVTLGAVGGEVLDEKPAQAKERPGEQRLLYVDGAKKYATPLELPDGGEALLLVDAPACVRKPTKAADCQRRMAADGLAFKMETVVDPGLLNRFPASEAVGAECEPVACSVTLGVEDPDGPEVDVRAGK